MSYIPSGSHLDPHCLVYKSSYVHLLVCVFISQIPLSVETNVQDRSISTSDGFIHIDFCWLTFDSTFWLLNPTSTTRPLPFRLSQQLLREREDRLAFQQEARA